MKKKIVVRSPEEVLKKIGIDFTKKLTLKEQYIKDKKAYKKRLHYVLRRCEFNGAGMRQLLQEFTDEVCGS